MLRALFGRDAPRIFEIGFGNGDNLLALAAAHPARDFLGVEVHRRASAGCCSGSRSGDWRTCASSVTTRSRSSSGRSPRSPCTKILILFPDPWPKKRHHKRRLIQRPFAEGWR